MTVRIGAAEVDRVKEQQFPVPLSLLTDGTEFIAPELRLLGCDDPALATASRLDLVTRLHDERAYLVPASF